MSEVNPTRTLSLLFADVAGFSKLNPHQIETYVRLVLPKIASVLGGHTPAAANTWGDGLFFAFEDPFAAANCALDLRDMFRNTLWERNGLPSDLGIRIAIHCGPIHVGHDPIRNASALFGEEVNRAARIEPIVSGTAVYATEVMRVLICSEPRFAFDGLGPRALAKGWGNQDLYVLRRSSDAPAAISERKPAQVTTVSAMPLANQALASRPELIGPLLRFADSLNFQSRVVRRNWIIKLKYDTSRLEDGVIVEHIHWEYDLQNISPQAVGHALKLVELGNNAAPDGPRLWRLLHIAGDRSEVLETAMHTNTGVFTNHTGEVTIEPGATEKSELVYPQEWSVNPAKPLIHNCFVPRQPVIGCRLEVDLPDGYSIGVLVGEHELQPESGLKDQVFRLPFLMALQAIEYVVERKG